MLCWASSFILLSPIAWKVIWYHETLSSILFTRNANSQLAIFKFCAMSARFGKIRHTTTTTLCCLLSLLASEIIPRYSLRNRELMSKNIFLRFSNTYRIDFLRYKFSFLPLCGEGSWIETLENMWWWRNGVFFARIFFTRLAKKWSGKSFFLQKMRERKLKKYKIMENITTV